MTQDGTNQTVPIPYNMWGGHGYEVHYVEDVEERPDPRLPWLVMVNGVGAWPIAWFYQRADAQNFADLVNQRTAGKAPQNG